MVVTHQSEACISQMLAGLNSDYDGRCVVYWVDNGSSEDSLAAYQKFLTETPLRYPVKPIWRSENVGYASAVNLALQYVAEPYTVLVNPDVEVSWRWMARIHAALKQHGAVIGGSRALRPDGSVDPNVGRFPGLIKNLVGSTFAPKDIESISRYYLDFSCIMFETEFLKRHLPLRQFFMYGEDVEFMLRVRRCAPKILYDRCAIYVHNRSSSSSSLPAKFPSKKAQRIVYANALLACEGAGIIYRMVFIFTGVVSAFLRVLASPFDGRKAAFLRAWIIQSRRIFFGKIYRKDMHVD